ncbi:MAG: NAD(P)H-dependent oxidoreductase subunit E [Sulfurimonas sp.]|nr:NAD(P)H-dependent oxidoreductase subunit E [Sulfurimonas sp.]MBU3939954.1 NAD(P)H-dependent oxidoreductase subunit E [bacterium]MBU4024069.1 NAD(P)H-dependent oxidoreductase subunit E [bacterium]MBU4059635.1 NAD(P)H-dependent oxidoreductase subunit E [bacterium]MBU4111542.1 NAD(P)H-dependent oxidoreductase subunit E [bacterium]
MNFIFTEENLIKIEALKLRYPSPQALCLPCLWMAQHQEGYISINAIDAISETLGIAPMEVYRVATFYTMFHLEPQEKLNVQVCKTLSCKLCGSDAILEHLKNKEVNIIHTECLGSCGTAPVMQINDTFYENLTPEKVDAILKELL